MKKIVIALFVTLLFVGCKKDKDCWVCENNMGIGSVQEPPYEVCGEEPSSVFTDQNGNQRSRVCTKQ